jgi:hypothetical protein
MSDSFFYDGTGWDGRNFIIFNDGGALPENGWSNEPIQDGDLFTIEVPPGSVEESQAWSSACDWYFVVVDDGPLAGIVLLNVYSRKGFLCKRKTTEFVRWFIDRPCPKRKQARPRKARESDAPSLFNAPLARSSPMKQ